MQVTEIAKVIYASSPTIYQSVMSQKESTVTISSLYCIINEKDSCSPNPNSELRLSRLGSFSF